jgi:hypothetical protein
VERHEIRRLEPGTELLRRGAAVLVDPADVVVELAAAREDRPEQQDEE